MPRLAVLAAVALGLVAVAGSGAPGADDARASTLTELVVVLDSPPLARAPGSEERIASEQRAFRNALAREIPEARVRWRYRLVANGFAVVLPESDAPRLRAVPGVRDVFASVRYEQQLDGTPQAMGAPGLWGAGLDTAGQGVKIGILDTGVDHAHPFFDPASYAMPAGFPKGQTRFTNAKVIVARAFAPPGAQYPNADVAVDGENSSARDARRRHRGRQPAHAGRGTNALRHRATCLHRELQVPRRHRLGVEPERERARDRGRHRGRRP